MRSTILVLSVTLGSLLAAIPAFAQRSEALKHARAGFDLEQKQQYPQALYEYNAAIAADPSYPYPLARIGGLYQQLKNFPLSIQYYERSIKLDSAFDLYSYFNIGLAFRIVEKHDSAILAMKEFLRRMEPTSAADSAAMRDADMWIKFNLGCIVEKAKPKNTEIPVELTELNSKFDDFGPTITADGQTIYFTSRRPGTGTKSTYETADYGDDLFVSHRDTAGHWSKPVPLPSPINSTEDEGAGSISADGQSLYYSLCRRPDGIGDCDVYMSELIGDNWTKPQDLGSNVNSNAWDAEPTVTADGNTMYFSSTRSGSIDGSEDIYVSYRTPSGVWTRAQNIGEPINTRFSERSPFISADGKTLYFSSNGHPGFSNHDLFLSRKMDDGSWSVPINLGSPINAYGDDVFLTIPASGDKIYYASQRANARADLNLYEAKLPNQFRPGPVTLVAGTVYDAKTNQPIAARIEVNDLKADQMIAVYRANKVTGKYYVTLGTGKTYGITARAPGYVFFSDSYTVPDTIPYRELTHDIAMQRLPDSMLASNGTSNTDAGNSGTKGAGNLNAAGNKNGGKPVDGNSGNSNAGTKNGNTGTKTGSTGTKTGSTGTKTGSTGTKTGSTGTKTGNTNPKSGNTGGNSGKTGSNTGKTGTNSGSTGNNGNKSGDNTNNGNSGIANNGGTNQGNNSGVKSGGLDTTGIILKNIFFDFNKATLRPESKTELRYLIDLLKEHPGYRIEIDGHTDNVGTPEFNQRLSLDRAIAVRDYLVSSGIAAKRLTAKGLGATVPRSTNETEEGRQQNRRTEFRFIMASR